jgi:Uma2 family endonuclease
LSTVAFGTSAFSLLNAMVLRHSTLFSCILAVLNSPTIFLRKGLSFFQQALFSSSTIFTLPNGAKRSPDVAWVKSDRWESLTLEEQEKFPPLCPDFVIELRSRTDSLSQLQEKMQEYLNSGLQLSWLINPQEQQVEIYRPNQAIEIVQLPTILSGEKVLPEFILDISLF